MGRARSIGLLALGGGLVTAMLFAGYRYGGEIGAGRRSSISVSDAKVCLGRGERVYFNVTLGTESYLRKMGEWERAQARSRTAQAFVISANTHVGTIRELDLDGKVFLRVDGVKYPAAGKPLGSTTHHNTYLVFFPNLDSRGSYIFTRQEGGFEVLIQGVGTLAERSFAFTNPLPIGDGVRRLGLIRLLALAASVLAALVISCTPCLMGSLAVGSWTIGTAWGEAKGGVEGVRARMTRQTAYCVGSIVIGYLAVVAILNGFGLRAEDLRPVEAFGGMVLIVVGVGLLRKFRPVARLLSRFHLDSRYGGETSIGPVDVAPAESSAMGGSLAMVCSVAGAPTLTTAIILPVLAFAGFDSLPWALSIVLVYLVASSVPFFLVARGLGEFLASASERLRTRLLLANSLVLIALGFLLILAQETVAGFISKPADWVLALVRWAA